VTAVAAINGLLLVAFLAGLALKVPALLQYSGKTA
jgi:hypothetical protein